MKTKAAQIMELYDGVRSTSEIAKIVGCLPEYVRVVVRQRKGAGVSEIDKRYFSSAKGRAYLDRKKPLVAARVRAENRVFAATANMDAANEMARLAYRVARLSGVPAIEANAEYATVRLKVARRLGDRKAAKLAGQHAYKTAMGASK